MKAPRLAFVIATKDRPAELRRLLLSLTGQTRRPDGLIVVDAGEASIEGILREAEFAALGARYERCLPPSATRQRNRGIALVPPEIGLIGFLDDDAVLAPRAVERMIEFWATAGAEVGGAQFNLVNHPAAFAAGLKKLALVEKVGLYSGRPGEVLPSGFQVMVGTVARTTFVRWLGTGASVWRREVFASFGFDEWFRGYGYLEDLDFSYRVGKSRRLAVVAGADYFHLPAKGGRGTGWGFGRREAKNRLHFVRKNPELSPARCCAALFLRMAISLAMAVRKGQGAYVARAAGTLVGIAQAILIPDASKGIR